MKETNYERQLITVVIILLLHVTQIAAQWDGMPNAGWASDYDEGTPQQFSITSEADLAQLAVMVNNGETFENATITLTTDLNLNDQEWTPIGSSGVNSFKGVFDGALYSIKGLKIDHTENKPDYFGLFGNLKGIVRNISVSGSIKVDVTNTNGIYSGGIAGYMDDAKCLIENVSNHVTIQCGNYPGSVHTGGIAGKVNDGIIRNCYNTSSVESTPKGGMGVYTGGIAGRTTSASKILVPVVNCYNTGAVSGGKSGSLVGLISGTLGNSYWLSETCTNGLGEMDYAGYTSGCGYFEDAGGSLTLDGDGALLKDNLLEALNTWVNDQATIPTLILWAVDNNINNGYPFLTVNEKPSTVVTTAEDVVDPTDNKISLREALFSYAEEGDVITFQHGLGSIMLGKRLEIPATMNITIQGNGEDQTILDGSEITNESFNSLFYITKGASIQIENLTIENCVGYDNTGAGAALYTYSDGLTVKQVTFRNNKAHQGGAVQNNTCSPTYINVTFENNKSDLRPASSDGGAMYNTYSSPLMINCKFLNNEANNYGGAIYSNNVSNKIGKSGIYINCLFSGNKAKEAANFMHTSTRPKQSLDNIAGPQFYNCTFTKDNISSDNPDGNLLYFYYYENTKNTEPLLVNCLLEKANVAEMIFIEKEDGSSSSLDEIIFKNCLTNDIYLGANSQSKANIIGKTDLGTDAHYKLLPGSPALNTGDISLYPGGTSNPDPNVDLAGLPRIIGSAIDIGAYEYQTTFNPGTIQGPATLKTGGTTIYTTSGETGGIWNSSNPAVASIDPTTGEVKALAPGTTTIFYTVSGEKATLDLTVSSPPTPPDPPVPVLHTVTIPTIENATTYPDAGEHTVEKGSTMTLLVFLSDDYDKSDVYLLANETRIDSEESKLRAKAYTFLIPVNEDMEIKIAGIEPNPIGNENAKAEGAKVWTSPGCIHVSQYAVSGRRYAERNTQNSLRIYTISGKLVIDEPFSFLRSAFCYKVPAGLYLIVIGDTVVKVMVND